MGTGDKKYRREINELLNRFVLREGDTIYPIQHHPDARDMIVEFVEPVKGLFESVATRYSVAIFAWNLSLAPENRRGELIGDFISPLVGDSGEGKRVFADLILSLVERRLSLYTDETFLILPIESESDDDPDDEDPLDEESLDEPLDDVDEEEDPYDDAY